MAEQTQYPVAFQETVQSIPALSAKELIESRKKLEQAIASVLKPDVHYRSYSKDGKPCLLKSGAEVLSQYFGFYEEFEITNRYEDWNAKPELFDYEFKCTIRARRDNSKIAEGFGSCNSWESKYKYRDASRACPACQRPSIIKGKEEFGGGWICWTKDPSTCCKAKFAENDPAITDQSIGRMDNPDIPTLKNTILKMAKKRSLIDGILLATCASELYTQDLDDLVVDAEIVGEKTKPVVKDAAKQEEKKKKEDPRATSEEMNELMAHARKCNWQVPEDLNAFLNKYWEEKKLPRSPILTHSLWKMVMKHVGENPKQPTAAA